MEHFFLCAPRQKFWRVLLVIVASVTVALVTAYARWLVQTSQHATLLSLLSTIVVWVGVQNDPTVLSDGVGCGLDDDNDDDASALSEWTVDMDAEECFQIVLEQLHETFDRRDSLVENR